jgi:glycosyltransferase involved in cell wall biosynthesis
MKASIIIPTYQRKVFLRDTLKSVIDQNFTEDDYEVFVVDNAPESTPELVALCDSSTRQPVCYIHEPRNGLHHARHAGARAANGEVIIYIDDDVICPPGWLAAMVKPFENKNVAMVAGKVVLQYEVSPPYWLLQFSSFLSAFDCGNEARALEPYASAVGCNMAVRKNALFEMGGFNPDGFGDRTLIRYRGDGECGLARKFYDAGLRVWYDPDAWLEHRVPTKRMTINYIEERAANSGIEAVYRIYRYQLPHPLELAGMSLLFIGKSLCHRILMYSKPKQSPEWFRHRVSSLQHRYRVFQYFRLLFSRKLREHTKSASYLM